MAINDSRYNVDLERYISRATRTPPSHLDWQTWRKVGPPGQYQAPPGSHRPFRGVRSGAGGPNYGPTGSHYNEFSGLMGDVASNAIQGAVGRANDIMERRSSGGGSNNSRGGSGMARRGSRQGVAHGGGTMSGSDRSQVASVTAPAGSRSMKRGRGAGGPSYQDVANTYGITQVQGNDFYGNISGGTFGGNAAGDSFTFGGGPSGPGFPPPGGNPPPPPPPSGGGFPPPSGGPAPASAPAGGVQQKPTLSAPPAPTQPAVPTAPFSPVKTQVSNAPASPAQAPEPLQGYTVPGQLSTMSAKKQGAYESMMNGEGRTQGERDLGFRGLGFQGPLMSEVGTGPQPPAGPQLALPATSTLTQPVEGPTNPASVKKRAPRQAKPALGRVPDIKGTGWGSGRPGTSRLIPQANNSQVARNN